MDNTKEIRSAINNLDNAVSLVKELIEYTECENLEMFNYFLDEAQGEITNIQELKKWI